MRLEVSLADTESYYANNSSARNLLLISVCLGSMLGPLSLATVNLALPTIALELGADAKTISWIPMGFLLCSVMFMLPAGKLADIYGRKRFYMIGVVVTGLLSIAASFAQSAEVLIVWRALQGFSMAIIFGSGLAILMSVFPDKNRGMAMGIYSAAVYFALTVSPVLGGVFTQYLGWRSVFWIQVPFSFIVTLLIIFTMPGEWRSASRARFDWTGSAIFACWAATFVYGVSGLPNWTSIATLIISLFYICLFIWHQSRVENPLISMKLFTENRVFAFSLAAGVLMYSANFPLSFILSIFLQLAKGMEPAQAGLIMLFQAGTMAIVAPVAGRISDKIEPRVVATVGCAFCVVGFLTIWFVSDDTPIWTIGVALVCLGFGFGFFTTPNNSAAMGAVDKAELGTASAAVNLSRTVGNLFGMSLVALIIHALIGPREFTPELNDELVTTVHIWMLVAAVCGLGAGLLSMARGRTLKRESLDR